MENRITRKVKSIRNHYSRYQKERRRLEQIPRYTPTVTDLPGFRMEVVDALTFLHGYDEIFKEKIYAFKSKSKNPVIIDCGANIGLATIFFKQNYPDSKVISFEPDPNIFNTLKNNVNSLSLENIELHCEAVSNEDGILEFNLEGGFSGRLNYETSGEKIEVPSTRLSNYLNSEVEFLKIDIEGEETNVISECEKDLHNVNHLFIEYHSHTSQPQRLDLLLKTLSSSGFRYHIKEAFTRNVPFINRKTMLGMDLQLNIFAYRE